MSTPVPMGNCGSGSGIKWKSAISGRIRPRKEGGSWISTHKREYNMVEDVSEAMVDYSENKKVKYERRHELDTNRLAFE